MLGKLIVLEGPDKVGKETQTRLLVMALEELGCRVADVEVPFNDRLTHKLIYWMLRSGRARSWPNLFQFVQFCNKVIFQVILLFWLLLLNDYVVMDRWALSAVIYGDASGTNTWFNRAMFWFLWRPDLTIVLHGPRLSNRETDVYEADSKLQQNVREGYYQWVQEHPIGYELVDNQGTRTEVHARILAAVQEVS